MSFPVLITPNLQLYSKDNSYLEYLYSVQQSDFSWSYIKVWNSMQTVCTKEPVTIASVIHHMRKNTCTHPTTASHHYRHINRKRQISMSTYLRVPFSPLSRLVKRLYKRVIWLWETEGKKKNKHISDSLQENTPLHQTTLPGDLNHGSSVFSLFLLLLEIISTTAFTSLLHIIQDTVDLSCSIITFLFFSSCWFLSSHL